MFVFYLTHCANDFCKDNKRQTIHTSDVISALKELDFESFEGPLQEFLEEYRREEMSKKTKGKKSDGAGDGAEDEEEEEMELAAPPAASTTTTTTTVTPKEET